MRDSQPLVSIITPTFNSQAYIAETIESVLNQTWQNWEMIIIDDGSTDSTEAIICSCGARDKRIKYFPLGVNSGRPSVPRNRGMQRAEGSYIAFLDSDDLWLPEKLERQVLFMEENKDIFMTYTGCVLQENGKATRVRPTVSREGSIFRPLFLLNNFIPCLTVMVRHGEKYRNKYLFDEDPRLRAIEDYDLWLTIARHESVGFINETLAVFRLRRGSIFGSGGIKAYIGRNNLVTRKYRYDLPKTMLAARYVSSYLQAFVGALTGKVS
jgi:teichuronic acid biosynthesis glycosyltransferase TuaG